MKKLVLFGILLFSVKHLVVPTAKAAYHGTKKTAHAAYKVVV